MGWLIALAVVTVLAVLPLGVSVKYDSGGFVLGVIAGPARITVIPAKKKPKTENKLEKTPQKKTEKPAKTKKTAPKEKSGGKLTDFLPLVHTVLDFVGDFRRKLRVDRLEMRIIMAGGDPCDLAINYGRAWTALGNLVPLLERCFVIKKRDLEVECDFVSEETLIYARLDLTITLGRVLSLGVRYGIRAVRELLKIMKLRKGGAVK